MLCAAEQVIQKISFAETMDAIGAFGPILIGLAVGWIAWQQHKLSKEKFKLDLFEKRYAVYKSFQKALTHILRDGKIDLDKIYGFRGETQDAYFLFDDGIWGYRDKIDKMMLDLHFLPKQYQGLPAGKERNVLCKKESELLRNLTGELPKLKEVFLPYLKFEKWK